MNSIASELGVGSLVDADTPRGASRATARLLVCAGIFVVLVGWAALFPYTGDGDSVLHYLNARDATATPVSGLHAWARPGAKLLMIPFALSGILATRAAMAVVAATTAWQTIRLAEELQLPRALLAGPMLLWQPLVFALASDTMTEMPMALGIVAAIRLWRNGWRRSSATLVGFLPMVRPEGFFLGVLWGVMVLVECAPGKSWKASHGWRIATLGLMALGLLTWAVLCWACTFNHDPLYVLHIWNWPPESFAYYGKGPLLHHVLWWPLYGGVPLTLLFVVGAGPAMRRAGMGLPWAVWLLVIGVHSVLYWRGWFASCGLMRIMACTAPVTALVCLQGWNAIASRGGAWSSKVTTPGAGLLGGLVCTAYAIGQYALDSRHYDCFPISRCIQYIRDQPLLGPDTWFFAGNQIATAGLNLPPHPSRVMANPCDAARIALNLDALPVGSVGVWDDRQAPIWHGHRIEDLAGHGFTILFDTTTAAPSYQCLYLGARGAVRLRYVVLRKDGPFTGVRQFGARREPSE